MKRSLFAGAFLFLAGHAGVAAAQGSPRVGVVITAPRTVGILWDVTTRFALRPDFGFSTSSTESTTAESSSTSLNFGLAGLFYVAKDTQGGVFVAPRAEYFSTTSESGAAELKSDGMRYSLTAGAEYSPVARLGFFGESGIAYSRGSLDNSTSGIKNRTTELRSVVGVVIYLR